MQTPVLDTGTVGFVQAPPEICTSVWFVTKEGLQYLTAWLYTLPTVRSNMAGSTRVGRLQTLSSAGTAMQLQTA